MSEIFSDPPSRQAIMDALAAEGAPLSIEELVLKMRVSSEAMVGMRRRVAAMQRDGQILAGRKGDLMLVSRIDLIPGTVQGHRDGFGFLLPDGDGPDKGPDIFLPPREMQKVMHGDRVLVRRIGTDNRGRPEGKIVEVTARSKRLVVGRLIEERGVLLVVPEDQRIKHEIIVEPGATMDARAGQVVSVEIIEPPGLNTPPIAQVREVLGDVGDAGMEIEIAVRKFDVPHRFSEALLAETAALPDALRPNDYRGRVDLRDVPLVTIDGEDARDFDDAVYCAPIESKAGGWRLLVAIADVSHYVRPGSELDNEAQARTTSVYFPRRVIPMLPEKLSNGLCSINPQVDRLVLVADMIVDGGGEVIAYQFYPAVMHSAARLTYDEVWGILSGENLDAIQKRQALLPELHHLHALYQALLKARQKRGAMEFETAETKMLCDERGRISAIVARHRNDAHRLIEECMLAANTCAADFLELNKHPGLYRVHEGPSPDRLAKLRDYLSGTGLRLGDVAAEKRENRGPRPQDYRVLSEQIQQRADKELLQTMMLRSMQQAVYTPENNGHFGLAYDAYAHFTSPIRRYPDLLNHRAIKALLEEKRYLPELAKIAQPVVGVSDIAVGGSIGQASAGAVPAAHSEGQEFANGTGGKGARGAKARAVAAGAAQPDTLTPGKGRSRSRQKTSVAESMAVWETLGIRCSANERRADEASRDVESWLKCVYMQDHLGENYRGRITGVAPFGIFVTLNDLYVEGMVHVSELGQEYFRFDDAAHAMIGERTGKRYALTDEVDVQVTAVKLDARRIDFRLMDERSAGRGKGGAGNAGFRQGAAQDARGFDAGSRQAARSSASRARGADQVASASVPPLAAVGPATEMERAGGARGAAGAPRVPALLGGARRSRSVVGGAATRNLRNQTVPVHLDVDAEDEDAAWLLEDTTSGRRSARSAGRRAGGKAVGAAASGAQAGAGKADKSARKSGGKAAGRAVSAPASASGASGRKSSADKGAGSRKKAARETARPGDEARPASRKRKK
ncbi:MAG: ribonuclease R [Lautropia sp.]|nr:ribonuclease R [Lautropia sp.]